MHLKTEILEQTSAIPSKIRMLIHSAKANIWANFIEINEIINVIYPLSIIHPKIGIINIFEIKNVNEIVLNLYIRIGKISKLADMLNAIVDITLLNNFLQTPLLSSLPSSYFLTPYSFFIALIEMGTIIHSKILFILRLNNTIPKVPRKES